jgi:hypothetical protein
MIGLLAWISFAMGALFCVSNFYLSFLRYPLHRLLGMPTDAYRWVSGVPIIGTLFVILALTALYPVQGVLPLAIILAVIDTGGIHWFIGTLLFQSLRANRSK